MIARLVPLVLVLAPSPLLAETCESARFEPPAPIADAVRPYVVCGMFSSEAVLNRFTGSESASVARPLRAGACATVRENAAREASQDMLATMPERATRERYVESVLRDADRFIAAAYTADAIGIDPAERLAACGTDDTRNPNASDY